MEACVGALNAPRRGARSYQKMFGVARRVQNGTAQNSYA